jgi:hypothetical protein
MFKKFEPSFIIFDEQDVRGVSPSHSSGGRYDKAKAKVGSPVVEGSTRRTVDLAVAARRSRRPDYAIVPR